MGLFSDKCVKCGKKVKKAARFCSGCGTAPSKGWWQCPTCKKWVGADSEFCWNCKTPMQIESRDILAGGKWVRTPGIIAQAFEVANLKPLLKNGFTIESGCAAVVLKDGKIVDVLKEGNHSLDGIMARIAKLGASSAKTIVLLDIAQIGLPLRIEDLRTSENIPVDFYGEIIVHLEPKDAEKLIQNILKQGRELKIDDLHNYLAQELNYVIKNHCQQSTIESLITDPNRRLELEDKLKEELKIVLGSIGVSLERIGGCDFTGPEYEKLRATSGEAELKRREFELNQKLRDATNAETMHSLKSEADVEEYVNNLAQERDLGSEDRSHELNILKQLHRHDIEATEATQQISIKSDWDDYNRDKMVADAKSTAEARAETFTQEAAEVEQALKWRAQKNDIANKNLKDKAAIFADQDTQTLIALCDDPHKREQLLKLYEQSVKAGISEKDILANAKLEHLKEQQALTEDNANRLERIMRESLQAIASSKQQNIIK